MLVEATVVEVLLNDKYRGAGVGGLLGLQNLGYRSAKTSPARIFRESPSLCSTATRMRLRAGTSAAP